MRKFLLIVVVVLLSVFITFNFCQAERELTVDVDGEET